MPKARSAAKVYQFKITLMESKPPIWRRIQVKDCTLDDLHEHIQSAMGWTNSHLHLFDIDGLIYGDPDLLEGDFSAPFEDSTDVKLSRLIADFGGKFRSEYEYDFGDAWRHKIVLEGISPPQAGVKYPICLKGARACPPEDSGGVREYQELLEALADPKHVRHAEATEYKGHLEPEKFDATQATRCMQEGVPGRRANDSWL